jgi:hypothetical protein
LAELAAFVGAALDVPPSAVVVRAENLAPVPAPSARAALDLPLVAVLSVLVLMLSLALISTRRAVRKRVEQAR